MKTYKKNTTFLALISVCSMQCLILSRILIVIIIIHIVNTYVAVNSKQWALSFNYTEISGWPTENLLKHVFSIYLYISIFIDVYPRLRAQRSLVVMIYRYIWDFHILHSWLLWNNIKFAKMIGTLKDHQWISANEKVHVCCSFFRKSNFDGNKMIRNELLVTMALSNIMHKIKWKPLYVYMWFMCVHMNVDGEETIFYAHNLMNANVNKFAFRISNKIAHY